MLNDEGMDVTLEEATEILSFLKFMANAVVKKFLNEKEKFLDQDSAITSRK
ncbi:hypothetical protein [Flavobacterium soyae]|uniref:Uncharacterized protein n=1 Tax=Flavobacterium soyae TaxID=2903098 RepID=A0ABZ2UC80_9FLAO